MIRVFIAVHALAYWVSRKERALARFDAAKAAVDKWQDKLKQALLRQGGSQ